MRRTTARAAVLAALMAIMILLPIRAVLAAEPAADASAGSCIFNMRDFGGYKGYNGKQIRKGLLFRSGELSFASDEDCEKLEDLKIGLVIDLRGKNEYKYCPDKRISGAQYRNIQVVSKCQSKRKASSRFKEAAKALGKTNARSYFAARAKTSSAGYLHDLFFKSYSRKQWKAFFKALLKNKGEKPVLFHCVHGKDRTGAAAALIMMSLGSSDKDILKEYMRTNEFIKAAGVKAGGKYGVKKKHLQNELGKITKRYGTYENYLLQGIGLRKSELKKLRRYYLQ